MVQIRKGGFGSGGGGGNTHHSNTNKKNGMYPNGIGAKIITYRNALLKLLLLVVIAIQLLFLSYKVLLVVLVPPPPPSLSTTTTTKHNNVRHVTRSDVINNNNNHANEHEEEETVPSEFDNNNNNNHKQEPPQNGIPEKEEEEQPQQSDVLKRFGTGPAREGYVVDLVGERQQRLSSKKLQDKFLFVMKYIQNIIQPKHTTMIASFIAATTTTTKAAKIQPCEYYQEPSTSSSSTTTTRMVPWMKAECTSTTTTTNQQQEQQQLYGYNSASFIRYYSKDPCGHHHHHDDTTHHTTNDPLTSLHPGTVLSIPPFDPKSCPTSTTSRTIYDICMTHVFPLEITNHDLKSIPPIVIYDATRPKPKEGEEEDGFGPSLSDLPTKSIPCDVPCQYDTNLRADIMNQNNNINDIIELGVLGTNWKMKQTISDPYYNGNAKIERTDYRRNIFYSTTSFKSSVPLTYYNFDTYNLRNTKAIDFATTKNAATYLLDTNCGLANRPKWVAAIQVVLKVEAYGSCQNNIQLLPDETITTMEGRIQLMRKNRIVLAFEAGTDRDRITSIVWEALLSGSVPAIFGASNLEQHLPPHSAIFTANYNSWDKFAAYLNEVANNETLWNSYHEWRTDEMALQKFEHRYAFVKSAPSPECRVCRWAYTKMYALGFNHTTQEIQPTKLSRNLCTSKTAKGNVVTKPFREQWYIANDQDVTKDADSSTCTPSTSLTDTIEVHGNEMGGKYIIERNVVAHDGIIDITVTSIVNVDPLVSGPLRLRLKIDNVRNTDGASFRDVHTWVTEATRTPLMSSVAIQDEFAKVTVITNCITPMYSPAEGVLEIEITSGKVEDQFESLRIRIILEDTDPIHDKLTEYFPSTYARRMMHDFIDPLELYYTLLSSS